MIAVNKTRNQFYRTANAIHKTWNQSRRLGFVPAKSSVLDSGKAGFRYGCSGKITIAEMGFGADIGYLAIAVIFVLLCVATLPGALYSACRRKLLRRLKTSPEEYQESAEARDSDDSANSKKEKRWLTDAPQDLVNPDSAKSRFENP